MVELVSVIIPTYQKFDFFYESLDSVLSQDYPNIELIVCDDFSEHFDLVGIEKYIRKNKGTNISNIVVYQNERNLGTIQNLNKAIYAAKGSIVCELSSDDSFYSPTTVSSIVERMVASNCSILSCRRAQIDQNGQVVRLMPTNGAVRLIEKMDQKEQHIRFATGEHFEMASGSCTYFRKDFFLRNGGYDRRLKLLEDWSFFLRVTRSVKISTAYDLITVKYRTGGISGAKNKTVIKDFVTMERDELSLLPERCPLFLRRYLKFNICRFSKNRWYLYAAFLDIVIRRAFYKIRFSRFVKRDIAKGDSYK